MPRVSRHLITTSDERTWKFDRPVIFMGEWCRLYDRKHIWQNMEAIVAAPYGLGSAKKDADAAEVQALEGRLLGVLCASLNQYHNTQHCTRFWRIVLGHWLRRYVAAMLNRVKTLQQCLQAHQISSTSIYDNNNCALAPSDSYSAIWAFSEDRWNNALIARILNLLGATNLQIELIGEGVLSGSCINDLAAHPTLRGTVLKLGTNFVAKMARCLVRDNDAFIVSSYLPMKEEVRLQLALRQCPQSWASPKLDVIEKPDRVLRKRLAEQFSNESDTTLENVLRLMLFELLPICYLEGFASLNNLAKQQPWPKSPKFIFTSNSFDTDEVLKLWAATKVELGSKYFTGQHGNNYGTYRYMHPTIEETTADKFLTWGWTDGLPQHTPAFVFKTAGKRTRHYNPRGGLLLIELCLNHRITTWDGTFEFADYFQEQQDFLRILANEPRQTLTIRLHGSYRYFNWSEESRWQAFDPTLKIDMDRVNIRELIAQSRLVVHSYDSTGILETLSQDIPTLAFWQNGFDHLRDSAKPYYQVLVDAGIVHLTPESIGKKVNEIWDDVDAWWGQSKVQNARKQFCERYARQSKNPALDLVQMLSNELL